MALLSGVRDRTSPGLIETTLCGAAGWNRSQKSGAWGRIRAWRVETTSGVRGKLGHRDAGTKKPAGHWAWRAKSGWQELLRISMVGDERISVVLELTILVLSPPGRGIRVTEYWLLEGAYPFAFNFPIPLDAHEQTAPFADPVPHHHRAGTHSQPMQPPQDITLHR